MSEHISAHKKAIIKTLIIVAIIFVGILLLFGFITGRIAEFFNDFAEITAPITFGFVIAYLSNPIVTLFEKYIYSWIHNFKIKRFISIFTTVLLILLFIITILVILIPSLINTLVSFWNTYIVNYEDSIRDLVITINSALDNLSFINSEDRLNPENIIAWIQEKFPLIDDIVNGDIADILPNVSGSISQNISAITDYALSLGISVFNIVKNILLGIFIAFYMLMSKERSKAYIRRFLNSFLSPKKVRSVIRFGKLLDRSFGGFIEGQLLDAIVVGIISYITFMIFGLPIPHLLATIIAVTNVIPIFGPFIGGIPAAFLVLLTAPEKTILFVILIFIIQQIDGNIICPHILGDKINISSLATIIAIITMGGLFGIAGMIIGVPIFAVAIHIINNYTMNALRKKGLETSLHNYHVGDLEQIESTQRSVIKFKKLFNKPNNKKKNSVKNKKNKENTNV